MIKAPFAACHIWPNEHAPFILSDAYQQAHGNIIIIGRGGSFILKDTAFRVRIYRSRSTAWKESYIAI